MKNTSEIETKKAAVKAVLWALLGIRQVSVAVNFDLEKIHALSDAGLFSLGLLTGIKTPIDRDDLIEELEACGLDEYFIKILEG